VEAGHANDAMRATRWRRCGKIPFFFKRGKKKGFFFSPPQKGFFFSPPPPNRGFFFPQKKKVFFFFFFFPTGFKRNSKETKKKAKCPPANFPSFWGVGGPFFKSADEPYLFWWGSLF